MSNKTGTILDYWGESPMNVGDPDKPYFKPGRPAKHREGIAFIAPWEEPFSGFPEHARRNARALQQAGENVHLRSIEPRLNWEKDKERRRIESECDDMLSCSVGTYKAQVLMFVPTDELLYAKVFHRFLGLEELASVNATKIIYNVWERGSISEAAVRCLNQVAQCWVACQANADMLVRCGIERERIRVVPIPFFPDDPLLQLRSRKRIPGPPRFYHIGKWEPRKEHRNIIGAFLMAFEHGQATLTLKLTDLNTKLEGYPQNEMQAIHSWLAADRVRSMGWTIDNVRRSIFIIKRRLSQDQMLEMHRMGDVYVTLSRGEGFDMPAYDAKLAGNRMVYVPSGGPQDFASVEDDERVEPSGEVPCHPFYGWQPGATYLDYSIDEAVAAMRRAARQVAGGAEQAISAHFAFLRKRFSAAYVGAAMAYYVSEL